MSARPAVRACSAAALAPASLALCLALALPTVAEAQDGAPPATDPKGMAVGLGEEALALHGQGHFKEAYERFETAEKIAHSPVFVLWMARSKRALEELVAARRLYEKVASEDLGPSPSAKWLAARDDAKSELAALLRRIPHLRVELHDAPADAALDLDGKPLQPGAEVEVDPGDHTVHVTSAERPTVSKSLHLEEGQAAQVVDLKMPAAHGKSAGSVVPGGVVLGVGLAGVAAGAITGGYALVLAGQVKDGCIGNQCRRSDEGKAADADTLARVSTGCLIAGSVIGAVGIGLLIARPRVGGDAPAISLDIGPTRFGVTMKL